jgi:hypothetical protein
VKPRILTIVQNLPLPFDRRVRLECDALVSAGYRFAVIPPCPGVCQRYLFLLAPETPIWRATRLY